MLRDKWFNGYSFTELANKYQVSDQTVKNVIYGIGDDILIRASNMKSPVE
jgi:Mor family transcriptional regulator